nr:hypothetical protein [Angustibacter aerolatus]
MRAAVCLEAVDRIHARSFEIAHSVMHTAGQPFVMAFQAAGPHAQDRALEAIAYALFEQRRVPASVVWEKPAKGEPLRMQKDYRVVPRGVALVIGCNTFPTWNSLPGALRLAGHRQRRRRQAAPARRAAAGDQRRCHPRDVARQRFQPRPGDAGRRGRRRGPGEDARARLDGAGDRLHRWPDVRRVARARGRRRRQAGAHGEGRREHRRDRLGARPARRPGQPRVLVLAVQRADVHHPAERLRAARRRRHRRGPPDLRRGSPTGSGRRCSG